MKRFLLIAGIILGIIVAFVGLISLKMWFNTPEMILARLKKGSGNIQQLTMKLSVARGETIPLIIEVYQDPGTAPALRGELLDILFKEYHRAGDEQILALLVEALKNPAPEIRRVPVLEFDLYGGREQRAHLIDLRNCYRRE